jgi:hypothetical protein
VISIQPSHVKEIRLLWESDKFLLMYLNLAAQSSLLLAANHCVFLHCLYNGLRITV